ncbi:MAG: hypothetical protein ACFFBI_05150 [Promethearchaeota archaeon]
MNHVEEKSAYPYITKFKKEPFISFAIVKRKNIGSFYLRNYNELIEFYKSFEENLFNDPNLNLENLFWFLLIRKYLKEEKKKNRNEIFKFIKNCEIREYEQLGFKLSPNSQTHADIYSTYLALGILKISGLLKEYLSMAGKDHTKEEIKTFVLSLRKGNKFLHCHDNHCDICRGISQSKTLFFVMEIFNFLGVDVRNNKDQFRTYIGDSKKKDEALIFRFLCLKYLDLDSEVKDKEIQYLHQLRKENGGYGYNQIESINDTFWIVYVLRLYSWMLEYNPSDVYLFINSKLEEILGNKENWYSSQLGDIAKLIILLSIIWKKFIDEIERVLFRELEKKNYIDINQLKATFGLASEAVDLISYINLNYNFHLRILDNNIEFKNYCRNLGEFHQKFIQKFYEQIRNKSIVSLSDMFKEFRTSNVKNLKLKEDIFPIIEDMNTKNFFKGSIKTKKGFFTKKKYIFYLSYFLEKIIVSDTEINVERIFEEKEKLEDIKNDIFNMTFKLSNIGVQIRDEVDSYLLINEIDYARERLKFIIRDAVMEADFLNENIENSFNEIFYFTNFHKVLSSEISKWNKIYSTLQNKLVEIDSILKGKIQEKEDQRNLKSLLENLMERLTLIEEDLEKKLDSFKKAFSETLEKEYFESKFNLVVQQLVQISEDINKYDRVIYNISQQITTKESEIVKKHKDVIENWLRIKEKYDSEYKFYHEGFQFFKENLKNIMVINEKLHNDIFEIGQITKTKIAENQLKEAFNNIKKESDVLLNEKLQEIKNIQNTVKNEVKKKQKLYLLFKHLQDNLENLESTIIDSIAKQAQSLKDKVTEERNKIEMNDFDEFVSGEIAKLKKKLANIKNMFSSSKIYKIEEVVKEFDLIQANFDKADKLFIKKLNSCKKNIEDFQEKSELTILQWDKFQNFFSNEASTLKDEIVNDIISKRINVMTVEKKTNTIKLIELGDELKLSCKAIIKRLKDMIEISKINAELDEVDKSILVYTDFYYLNKNFKNYIDNQLLKPNRERVGKILALYDSSIRNMTLNTNMLELQNRINDLRVFEEIIPKKFYDKVAALQIDQDREEFIETKIYFESVIENSLSAIDKIATNLTLFNSTQNFIEQQFNSIEIELKEYFSRFLKESEDYDSYSVIEEDHNNRKSEFRERIRQSQEKIEEEIRIISNKTDDSNKLIPEIRESFVKKKNEFLEKFNNKIERIQEQIEVMKNESFRGKLMDHINNNKIKLSQLLGNLEKKVEDNIEIKEFKRVNVIVQKRAKNIESEIKELTKSTNTMIKEYKKQSKNFTQFSKFILEDFKKFTNEYSEILDEKVKSLERLILKAYIEMTIKAVANEFLTINFLNNELKIRKQNIQDHLLYLISTGELQGKYDPRFSIYFENPEVLDGIDEAELEVIKSTNFKFQMIKHNLRNFAVQYGPIIALFSSIVGFSWYLFLITGNNPAALIIPIIITIVIIIYYVIKRREEKVS